jgi:tight adherence protein C
MQVDAIQIIVSLMLFTSVFLLIWSLFRFPVQPEVPIHRRIAMMMGAYKRQTVFEQPVLLPAMNLFLVIAQRLSFPALRDWIRTKLDASGNENSYSIDEYIAICLASSMTLAAMTLAVGRIMFGWFDPLVTIVMIILGFVLPLWLLSEASGARVRRISKKIPYTLDLIALMIAAGSTFTEAINTLIRDDPEDDFNQELRIVMAEIEFGTRRADSLQNMANRIPLDTLRSIVGAINQAEAMGTPLSDILKSQSGMIRMHRSVRAEKLSASASLRILLPTMLILGAAVLALFGPILVDFILNGGSFG